MNTYYTNGLKPVVAVYRSAQIPKMSGNPLINALPAIKSDDDWLEQLLFLPAFDRAQLLDEAYLRAYCVAELKDAFIPCDRHLSLARRIDLLIRWGYRKRNPLSPERAASLQKTYEKAQLSNRAEKMVFDENAPICSFSLIGASGVGKSTTMEGILASYPQYLIHKDHNLNQVVWLKVECPKDGSVKELALNVLRAFDRVLGTKHAPERSSNITSPFLTSKVNHLANVHCLGILVLDELQNLSVKKSGGREEMLNWFQELVNDLRLPVVMLGTFKAKSILQLDTRHTRRKAITGSATWEPMAMGPEFELLLQSIWEYQWLKTPSALTDELTHAIYEETQGVSAFIVDMFLVAQLHALRQKDEAITPKLFKHVARTEFAPLQPFLAALRSKDPKRLTKFEDALSYHIDEIIESEQRLITHGAGYKSPAEAEGISMAARATANVREALGLPDGEARKLVNQVLHGSQKTVSAITQAAIAFYIRASQSNHGSKDNLAGEELK